MSQSVGRLIGRKASIVRLLAAPFLAAVAACSPLIASTTPGTAAPRAGPPPYTGLLLENLDGYQATHHLEFRGNFDWGYTLEMRADGHAIEYLLHLTGLSPARNPGDVRLVTADGSSRMRGPGTDDECLVFPSDLPQGPRFILPDDLVEPDSLSRLLNPVQIETIAGIDTIHYSIASDELDGWRDARLDLWRDESTGAALRYTLEASGPDPFFGAGEGTVSSEFSVIQVGPQAIEPIAGCEIDLPLPAGSTNLTRLPDLIGFDNPAPPEQVSAFYQAELPASGWAAAADPQAGEAVILLSYSRAEQTLEINIEALGTGSHTELLLGSQ